MAERQKQDEAKEPLKAARAAVADVEPGADAESFPVERLIAESEDFLDQPSHVVAGALHGVNKKSLTLEETEAAVQAWLKAPVKEA